VCVVFIDPFSIRISLTREAALRRIPPREGMKEGGRKGGREG